MSDYLFMLESHLLPSQREVVTMVETAAAGSDDQVFLVGGAMRDMLGGFSITDLDFAVQGNALALAKKVARMGQAEIVETDTRVKSAELRFPSGVTASVAMARTDRFPKAGAPPQIKPATIHDDLLRRDFTINAIALSLNPASRGLLLDPSNGLADLELREIRAIGNYGFYDDPVRMLRLVRFRIRCGFTVHERTQSQYANAREGGMESRIPPRARFRELRAIADEPNAGEVIAELEKENLINLFSPAFTAAKLNPGGLSKLEKARQMIPHGVNLRLDNLGLFLSVLTEKLTPKERTAMAAGLKMEKAEIDLWQMLEPRSRKLEKGLTSPHSRSSEIYQRLMEAPGDEILYLYLNSKERIVHDRIRNFLQKHLYMALEVTNRDVAVMAGLEPDDPQVAALREELVLARLDGRKWTPPAPPKAAAEEPQSRRTARKATKKSTHPKTAKKPAPKKAAAPAAAAKKPAKKTVAKIAAKEAPPKKAPATKAAVTSGAKTPAKKTVAKATAKKPPRKLAKKTAAKGAARKAPSKKAPTTKAGTKSAAKKKK